MIRAIHFQNFKALREATLPLGPFTLIVGPNGSGKSTAMQGLRFVSEPDAYKFDEIATAGWERKSDPVVEVEIEWLENSRKTIIVSGQELKRTFGPALRNDGFITDALIKEFAGF